MKRENENSAFLLDYVGDDSIVQVLLKPVPERFAGKTLAETGIKPEHNLLVMVVERDKPMAAADIVFQPGDKLTVFGKYKTICDVFEAQERMA